MWAQQQVATTRSCMYLPLDIRLQCQSRIHILMQKSNRQRRWVYGSSSLVPPVTNSEKPKIAPSKPTCTPAHLEWENQPLQTIKCYAMFYDRHTSLSIGWSRWSLCTWYCSMWQSVLSSQCSYMNPRHESRLGATDWQKHMLGNKQRTLVWYIAIYFLAFLS